jgi:predicted unusual protein kinase regulating ubiquinone biosynthesis (AarF/ABC1/UbiB family)
MADRERNRLGARVGRMARVGAGLTGAAFSAGTAKILGGDEGDQRAARAITEALGGMKGPVMKVAQIMATIPDFLPPEYAEELSRLQAHAPAMGRAFMRRRMKSELGPDWSQRFAHFEEEAAHAASLGQVHRATLHDGRDVAVKLQYPDMQSAVESDLSQLKTALGVFQRFEKSIDASAAVEEISARLREELDYGHEANAIRLFGIMTAAAEQVDVPEVINDLTTNRLITMTWLDGDRLDAFEGADQEARNAIAKALFAAWWGPFYGYGVVHGDPHLGNYKVAQGEGGAMRLSLMDFGCIRVFPPGFVEGPIKLFHALRNEDRQAQREAYETWGFEGISDEVMDALNIWARFLYGPLMEDRVREIADGVSPAEYGRREVFEVRQKLRKLGPVKIPREFVFMDRAAIGVGAALLRLKAKLNFHELYMEAIEGFSVDALAARQADALTRAGFTDKTG